MLGDRSVSVDFLGVTLLHPNEHIHQRLLEVGRSSEVGKGNTGSALFRYFAGADLKRRLAVRGSRSV